MHRANTLVCSPLPRPPSLSHTHAPLKPSAASVTSLFIRPPCPDPPAQDFGLSWRLEAGQSRVTGIRHGTPYYCPPEVSDLGYVTLASDVYR